jgi:hypothetical protein
MVEHLPNKLKALSLHSTTKNIYITFKKWGIMRKKSNTNHDVFSEDDGQLKGIAALKATG